MGRLMLVIFFLMIPVVCFAQDAVTQASPKGEEKEPAYIPQNLEECFVELNKVLSKEDIETFKNKKEEEIVDYHFGLGMWMRNNWGLWKGSRLAKYFNNMGIFHPDDMSSIILNSFHRHLNNKEIRLEEQVKHCQEYWEKIKNKENR